MLQAVKGLKGFKSYDKRSFRKALSTKRPEYTLIGDYLGYAVETDFQHNCGIQFSGRPESMLSGGKNCPCQNTRATKHTETTLKLKLASFEYDWDLVTFDEKSNHLWENKLCGCRIRMTHRRVIGWSSNNGRGIKCPNCYGNQGMAMPLLEYQYRLDTKWGLGLFVVHNDGVSCLDCGYHIERNLSDVSKQEAYPCPVCRVGPASYRPYTVHGVTKLVHGVEDLALDWILRHKKAQLSDIVAHSDSNRLSIGYTFKGKDRTYYPDFWIPDDNIVVEVKSIESLGFGDGFYSYPETYEMNAHKAKATIEQGYLFKLLVMSRVTNTKIQIPRNWYDFSRSDLQKALGLN